ncbi:hypothetical protein H310_09206 [Aphanomyces invadans]|uniref:Uncharacterized protein n=1 Tax=Aphanomyces invadans TaxID=157072 RepID=A0A024TV84_9STRA|nr:hypothetical protein H310_09206 [Aphanomyces invadans]ETV97884.1 hypothetical protein H310_09206 [Aphanomyces invadans]|eukprot:XP_008873445.1 hypothetical protein H310_09206 [Aphanomyces invadans]
MSAVHEDVYVDEEPAVPSNPPFCRVLSKGTLQIVHTFPAFDSPRLGLAWNFGSIALNPFLQCYARGIKNSNPINVCFKEFRGLGRAICKFTLQHSVLETAPPTYIFNIVLPACRRSP